MGAREYDFRLGRWLSADSIVPDPANPQSLNRYAYVHGNPLRYIDPSGHTPVDLCQYTTLIPGCQDGPVYFSSNLVSFSGNWELQYRHNVVQNVEDAAAEMYSAVQADQLRARHIADTIGGDPSDYSSASHLWGLSQDELFQTVMGDVTYVRSANQCADCWASVNGSTVTVYDNAFSNPNYLQQGKLNSGHELGHVFAQRTGWVPDPTRPSGGQYKAYLRLEQTWAVEPTMPRRPANPRTNAGPFAGTYLGWQQSTDPSSNEMFADMFLGWTYDNWSTTPNAGGSSASGWMNMNMPALIPLAVAGP
jgi:hypothetical protein